MPVGAASASSSVLRWDDFFPNTPPGCSDAPLPIGVAAVHLAESCSSVRDIAALTQASPRCYAAFIIANKRTAAAAAAAEARRLLKEHQHRAIVKAIAAKAAAVALHHQEDSWLASWQTARVVRSATAPRTTSRESASSSDLS